MTSSLKNIKEVYVWIWLPHEGQPVVGGKLAKLDDRIVFTYGRSYLENPRAIAIYDQELPLKKGVQEKRFGTERIPGCLRDSAPDAWGRRVILNKLLGVKGVKSDPALLDEFVYLLESGSDRIGALDFQKSAEAYHPRLAGQASLEELLLSAELIEQGRPISDDLAQAIYHGTSIGGARPKVLIDDQRSKYIAKFSSSTDHYNIIKAEFMAMRLAKYCGLNVADVELIKVLGRDILKIQRFDRFYEEGQWKRKLMLSALTLLDLDEMTARYASYETLAEIVRYRFSEPKETLRELYARIVFNILCGNTDDHARNHAAFWDGKTLSLSPAYDICPQMRAGREATQAMMIHGEDRSSRLITCLKSASQFMLKDKQARQIIDHQVEVLREKWKQVCHEADLSEVDEALFRTGMFLPSYAFDSYQGGRTPAL